MCDLETNQCQTVLCGGSCLKDSDCQDFPGCVCEFPFGSGEPGACAIATCGNICSKGECRSGQPEGDSCVCDFETDTCVTIACPGFCEDNIDCQERGQDDCACFFGSGVNVGRAVDVEAAIAGRSGPAGSSGPGIEGGAGPVCGTCLGAGAFCNASTECCGQLVCRNANVGPSQEGLFAGTCQRKPKPKPKPKPKKERCAKHGHDCTQDDGCCGQGVCFRGLCGEKDTHCNSDNECARGYSCVGGRQTGGHRRCRRNKRNKLHRRRNRG